MYKIDFIITNNAGRMPSVCVCDMQSKKPTQLAGDDDTMYTVRRYIVVEIHYCTINSF